MSIMSELFGTDSVVITDGYSGFPAKTQPLYGHRPGTVEWLLDAIERHAKAEADALDQYEHIRTASGDPVIALVMRLILEDEERHHGLLKRMQATLNDALSWSHSPNALPETGTPRETVAPELATATRALIEEEHTGARYMRNLAHEEKGIDAGLHSLLLEMMALDSDKHARLLEFVQSRLAKRASSKNTSPE
jgi:rubrerythrin